MAHFLSGPPPCEQQRMMPPHQQQQQMMANMNWDITQLQNQQQGGYRRASAPLSRRSSGAKFGMPAVPERYDDDDDISMAAASAAASSQSQTLPSALMLLSP